MKLGNRQQLAAERRAFEDAADAVIFSLDHEPHTCRRVARAVIRSGWDDPSVITNIWPGGRTFRCGVIIGGKPQ